MVRRRAALTALDAAAARGLGEHLDRPHCKRRTGLEPATSSWELPFCAANAVQNRIVGGSAAFLSYRGVARRVSPTVGPRPRRSLTVMMHAAIPHRNASADTHEREFGFVLAPLSPSPLRLPPSALRLVEAQHLSTVRARMAHRVATPPHPPAGRNAWWRRRRVASSCSRTWPVHKPRSGRRVRRADDRDRRVATMVGDRRWFPARGW